MISNGRHFSLWSYFRWFFSNNRRLFWSLSLFLVIFVFASTAVLIKLQGRLDVPAPPDLLAQSSDLHTLVSGSLHLSGLSPDEMLRQEKVEIAGGGQHWNEYSSEISITESFPLKGWLGGLEASLERAGARLISTEEEGLLTVSVLYHPPGWPGEVLVESLEIRTKPPIKQVVPRKVKNGARGAIVIDDLGQNPAHFRRLAELGIPITVSVLPDLPYSRKTALQAAEHGMEIMLHLPMEPIDFPEKHPGPGALFLGMSSAEIREQLRRNIESLKGVVGVNNHMGSRLTADARAMNVVMEVLKDRDLFFLDSKTSPHSVAFETAFLHHLPSVERDIFLDAYTDKEFIRGQVHKLIAIARKEGSAIGIGHPYDNTLEVLEEMKDEITDSGIDWVPVSKLTILPEAGEAAEVSSRQP